MDEESIEDKEILGLDGVSELLEKEIQILSKKIGTEKLKFLKKKKSELK